MNIQKRPGGFGRAFLPFIIIIALNIVVSLVVTYLGTGSLDAILGSSQSSETDVSLTLEASLIFSIIGFILFAIWYRRKYIRPNRYDYEDVQRGFSLPLILALIILAVGMQFLCQYILNGLGNLLPSQVTSYTQSMASLNIWSLGFSTSGIMLFCYAIILGPIMEETVFRGLIMGSCLETGGFWAANIVQAVLFGIYHMNLVQGIYAFAMGLFLGYVAYRGKGIRYSITLHIIFNIIGLFWSSIVTNVVTLFSRGCLVVAIILTVFALYVYTDEFHIPKAYRNKTAARSINQAGHRSRRTFSDNEDLSYENYRDNYDRNTSYEDSYSGNNSAYGRSYNRSGESENLSDTGEDYNGDTYDTYASGKNRRYDYGDDEYDSRY